MVERGNGIDRTVRESICRARRHDDPGIEQLVARMPNLVAEAARRRRLAGGPAARISVAATTWLPRLAVATVLLVATAMFWPQRTVHGAGVASPSASAFDRWLSDGTGLDGGSDPVTRALID